MKNVPISEQLIERIRRDMLDSWDEELEVDVEDYHPLPGLPDGGANGAGEKAYRKKILRAAVPPAGRAREASGLGGGHQAEGCEEIPKQGVVLPERQRHEHYSRQAVPQHMLVPEIY